MYMRRLLVPAFVLALLLAGSTNALASSLLLNGDLDLTFANEIVPGFFLPKPQGWQNIGSRSITGVYHDEMSSEPWAGPAPTPVTANGNLNPPTPEGCGGPDCAVFFKPFSGNLVDGAATGTLYQDVVGSAGTHYTFTGWAGGEANALMTDAVFAIDFLNGANALIGSASLSLMPGLFVPNGMPFNYKQFSVDGIAPVGTVTVRARISMIGGMSNPAGGPQAFVVDDFTLTDDRVAAVPEPTTILLTAGGLAGLVRRRLKTRATR